MRARWFACLSLLACHAADDSVSAPAQKRVVGAVVASVNGAPIGLAEVRELAEAQALDPRTALGLLVDAELLAQHALALGYGRGPAVVREQRRAAVRLLLAREIPDAAVGEQRERYKALLAELTRRTPVTLDEDELARLLADPALWRAAEAR